jgi:hypothetical protein
MRQFKDPMCRFNGGSGFPAAICTAVVKTIRGWKAAPTEIFQMPFVLTGYAPNGVWAAPVPIRLRRAQWFALRWFDILS